MKKTLSILLSLCLLPLMGAKQSVFLGQNGGPVAVNSVVIAGGTSGATSSPVNMVGANFCFFTYAYSSGSSPAISSSPANTWTTLTSGTTTSNMKIVLAYSASPSVSSAMTFTINGGSTFPSGVAKCYSNASTATPAFIAPATTTTASSISTGSITPPTYSLVVTALGNDGSNTYSVTSPYVISQATNFSAGVYYGSALADANLSATTNPTWSFGGGTANGSVAIIAVLAPR